MPLSTMSVLLVEETTDLLQVTDKLVLSTGFELTTLVVIVTDCIGSYKFNYRTITTTTAPSMSVYINTKYMYSISIVK